MPVTVDNLIEQNPNAANQGKQSGKKRRASTDSNGLIEMLGKMHEDTNLRLDRPTDKIGYDLAVSKSRKEVFEKLGVIPGLTLQQQIDAAGIILDKVERLDLFMSLPEVARCTFVMTELERNGFI